MYTHINMCPVYVYWKWWDHINTSNSNLIPLYSPKLGSDTSCQTISSPSSHKYTLLTPLKLWTFCFGLSLPYTQSRLPLCLFSPNCLNTGLFRKGRGENGKKSKNQRLILNHRWTLNNIFSAHKPPVGLHEENVFFYEVLISLQSSDFP